MIRIIQVIGVIVGVYMIVRSFLYTRKRHGDISEFLIWLLIGILIIIGSVFPGIIGFLADILQMEQRVYTLFVFAFLLVFLLLMRLFRENRRLGVEISKLNEEMSLQKFELRKKRKD